MSEEQRAPLYLRGIELFNEGEYFDCHEVWEELWIDETGEDRRFYQGLIQGAVALYHLENGNAIGARKLVDSSAAYLRGFEPKHAGLDVKAFVGGIRRCFDENVHARTDCPGDLDGRPAIDLLPPEGCR